MHMQQEAKHLAITVMTYNVLALARVGAARSAENVACCVPRGAMTCIKPARKEGHSVRCGPLGVGMQRPGVVDLPAWGGTATQNRWRAQARCGVLEPALS